MKTLYDLLAIWESTKLAGHRTPNSKILVRAQFPKPIKCYLDMILVKN